eukprot:6534236-Prymnesium_polylepis.1
MAGFATRRALSCGYSTRAIPVRASRRSVWPPRVSAVGLTLRPRARATASAFTGGQSCVSRSSQHTLRAVRPCEARGAESRGREGGPSRGRLHIVPAFHASPRSAHGGPANLRAGGARSATMCSVAGGARSATAVSRSPVTFRMKPESNHVACGRQPHEEAAGGFGQSETGNVVRQRDHHT